MPLVAFLVSADQPCPDRKALGSTGPQCRLWQGRPCLIQKVSLLRSHSPSSDFDGGIAGSYHSGSATAPLMKAAFPTLLRETGQRSLLQHYEALSRQQQDLLETSLQVNRTLCRPLWPAVTINVLIGNTSSCISEDVCQCCRVWTSNSSRATLIVAPLNKVQRDACALVHFLCADD